MEPKRRALWVLVLLVAIDLMLAVTYVLTYESSSQLLSGAFHLDYEQNIPSTWSAAQLLFASFAVLACIPVDARSKLCRSSLPCWHLWLFIGSVLLLMAIDEYVTYHERLRSVIFSLGIMSPGEATIGGYAWPWTIYGAVFVLVVGVPAAIFSWQAFSRQRYLFHLLLLAGLVFVAGAIGFENLRVFSINYHGAMAANLLVTLEETCEMVAVSLVTFVFLRYRGERLLEKESVAESASVPIFTRKEAPGS